MNSRKVLTLDKYKLIEELGKGGFATVFRVVDTTLNREVALKVLDPLLMRDDMWAERFRREAKMIAALKHPAIVSIYEVNEVEGRLYLAMELAAGGSLAGVIAARGCLSWAETLALLKSVCEALDYAHGQGVIHRDLKPANILLTAEGQPLLTDFGFARLLGDNSMSLSLSGGILGTPAYIAPEVWELDAADAPADIYALGCIIYEVVTGEVLFQSKTPMQAVRAHDQGPKYTETWPEGTPDGLAAALNKALARDPAARYPTAGTFWHAINALEAQAETARQAAQLAAVAAQWRAETKSAMQAGEWSTAKLTVGRWLKVAPEDKEALTARQQIEEHEAEVAAEETREEQAREAVRKSAERATVAAQWKVEAEAALADKNWSAAKRAIEHWLAVSPEDRAALAAHQQIEKHKAEVAAQQSQAEATLKAQAKATRQTYEEQNRVSPGSSIFHGLAKQKQVGKQRIPLRYLGAGSCLIAIIGIVLFIMLRIGQPSPQEPVVIKETVVVEKTIEIPIEKTVEIAVEKTIEVQVEKTVEIVVEKDTEKTAEAEVEKVVEVTPEPIKFDRKGAWIDTVVVIQEPSADQAVARLEVGEMDLYAFQISNSELAAKIVASPNVDGYRSFGSYNELTFNPSGPIFPGTGKLNPFAVARMREAMNYLVDRTYITQEIMGGLGTARWTCFNSASNDAALMADVIRAIELKYAYNPDQAAEIIGEEMEKLGATLVRGKWQYKGQPVEIIILIRIEDERRVIGDYVGNQLEDIGFTVIRDYKSAAEASPIWLNGNPADGLFHIYTGGWITTAVPRNLADNFAFFYTNMGMAAPLWQTYVNEPGFYDLTDRLNRSNFRTQGERREMIAQALELAMKDSVRIWLADRGNITPKRTEVKVAADLYGAVSGAWLWPLTIQREGHIGGSMTIGIPSILPEPWNPLDGSNGLYDIMLIRATGEMAALPDPYTGLYHPQRLERAEVIVKTGTPIVKTLDWVDLQFVSNIQVPNDAWVDWDAKAQRFLTAREVYPQTETVVRKSVVYYPTDMFDTVTWHDGSRLSIGDFVMNMILTFDRAKEDSPYYDATKVPAFNFFMGAFRGVRIVSKNPLIIETYSNDFQPDAENSVATWWPYYAQGQGSWHMLALGLMAEDKGKAAFSAAKADLLKTERLSYVAGPTLAILKAQLDEISETNAILYAPTLGQFVNAAEIKTRFANYAEWYRRRGHFWIGTGPLYLERAFPVEGNIILKHFSDYPDMADKWMRFTEVPIADVKLDGPGRVTIGQEAPYDVFITLGDDPYPVADISNVKYLVINAEGEVAYVGEAKAVEDGLFKITLNKNVTSKLVAGSSKMEVVVVSKLVAVPSFDSLTFVAAP